MLLDDAKQNRLLCFRNCIFLPLKEQAAFFTFPSGLHYSNPQIWLKLWDCGEIDQNHESRQRENSGVAVLKGFRRRCLWNCNKLGQVQWKQPGWPRCHSMWLAALIEMCFSLVVLGESCLSLPKKQVPKRQSQALSYDAQSWNEGWWTQLGDHDWITSWGKIIKYWSRLSREVVGSLSLYVLRSEDKALRKLMWL